MVSVWGIYSPFFEYTGYRGFEQAFGDKRIENDYLRKVEEKQ
jgi:hypothetical protein